MPSADKTAKQSAASQTDQGTIGFINTSASTPTVLPEKVLVEEAGHSQTIPKIYDLKLSQENDEIPEEMPPPYPGIPREMTGQTVKTNSNLVSSAPSVTLLMGDSLTKLFKETNSGKELRAPTLKKATATLEKIHQRQVNLYDHITFIVGTNDLEKPTFIFRQEADQMISLSKLYCSNAKM